MTLRPREDHPHGPADREFDGLWTTDKPVIFAYLGYPYLIHRLTYRRNNHAIIHVPRLPGSRHDDDALRHGR